MSCKKCNLSVNNSVHKNKTQYGYHEFEEPLRKEYKPTIDERLETLERRVENLEIKGEKECNRTKK